MVLLSSDKSVVYVYKDIKLGKILCSPLHIIDSDSAYIYWMLGFLHCIRHFNQSHAPILVYLNV